MAEQTLLMLSGGLDSMVLAYKLAAQKVNFRAVFFDHGKSPVQAEHKSAQHVARTLKVPLDVVDMTGLQKVARDYNATISDVDELDCRRAVSGFPVLISAATYYAQLIEVPRISLAIISEDTVTRPNALRFFNEYSALIKVLTPDAIQVEIDTPLASMTKTEVVRLGSQLQVPMELSWTCHYGRAKHDGECPACKRRKEAFQQAAVTDLTQYLA